MQEKEIYRKSSELFDNCCAICGNPEVAMHHIRFGGYRGGRKTYYGNVIPLCPYHHNEVHAHKKTYMEKLIKLIDDKINGEDNE